MTQEAYLQNNFRGDNFHVLVVKFVLVSGEITSNGITCNI